MQREMANWTSYSIFLLLIYFSVSYRHPGVQAACNFASYTEYRDDFRARYAQEANRMYPFGTDFCDTNATDSGKNMGFDAEIDFSLPFYGDVYHSAYVSPHGHISLHRTNQAKATPYFYREEWPNQDYPLNDAPDPAFIAQFYSEASFRWGVSGEVGISFLSYRILSPERAGVPENEREVMIGMLNEISQDVRKAVVGASTFTATHGLVVTWYKVTFEGSGCTGGAADNCRRNTYQTAIVTDEVSTFVVFNYFNIQWVGGAVLNRQNCDPMSGTSSSSHQSCSPAHVGFNAGEARGFTKLPYSNTEKVKDIDDNGGSDVEGRFIYQISGDRIVRGGCSNDTSLSSVAWPLEISPRHGSMFGGHEVYISATCFTQPSLVRCRFGDVTTEARYDGNLMQMRCVSPMQDRIGTVKVAVSDHLGNFHRETDYVIDLVDHTGPGVTITNPGGDWLDTETLTLTWDPYDLAGETEIGAKIDVKLFGYREYETHGHLEKSWNSLATFVSDSINDGRYDVITSQHSCNIQNCQHYTQGAIQVSLTQSNPGNRRAIWTEMIPLGWYIKDDMDDRHGGGWAGYLCREWSVKDGQDTSWLGSLQPCPCTLQQALSDFGRFQADPSCATGTCGIHVGAAHCVLSTGATVISGSGTSCCYDDGGALMYSGDTMYGSFSERSHSWGSHPYRNPTSVPTLSHWVHDIAPYHYCCIWSDDKDNCYNRYMKRRPTMSCQQYQSPGFAIAFGDPHFKTLDETSYTFNGVGEYWLLKVTGAEVEGQSVSFALQARLQQVPQMGYGHIQATSITAVAMQQNSGSIVAIETNLYNPHKELSVNVDGSVLEFTDGEKWQYFRDFAIVNNNPAGDTSCSNFSVVYNSGVGVVVTYANGPLQVKTSAPPAFFEKTLGLFGVWNDEPSDDLQPKEPSSPPVSPDDPYAVHFDFGRTWEVSSSESRFTNLYRAKLNYDYYRDPDFLPHFDPVIPSNSTLTEGQVNQVCGGDDPCTYDYMMTVSQDIATDALNIRDWYEEIKEMSDPVVSCSYLDIPNAIKREPISYLGNTTTVITGCRDGYSLKGPDTYHCQDAGDGTAYWKPSVSTECKEDDGGLSTAAIVAISVSGFLILVLIIIGVVVLCLVLRRRKRRKEGETAAKQPYSDVVTTEKMIADNPPDLLITKPPTPPPAESPPPPPPQATPLYTKPTKNSNRPPRAPLKLSDNLDINTSKSRANGQHPQDRAPSVDDVALGHRAATPSVQSWDDADITPPADRRGNPQQVDMYPNPNYTSMTSSDEADHVNTPMQKRPAPYSYTNHPRQPDEVDYLTNKSKKPKPKSIHHVHNPAFNNSANLSSDADSSKGEVSDYYKKKYKNRYKNY